MSNPILNFVYPNGHLLESKSRNFLDAIKFVFEAPGLKNHTPLKLVVKSTGKILYFDDLKFKAFANDEITIEELIQETECEGLFRNKVDIELNKSDIIDTGSLWKLIKGKYILVDSERYIAVVAPDDNFKEI